MVKSLLISLKICLFTLLLTGVFYPLLVMGGGYLFFYKKTRGSLVFNEQHQIVGSELIGQNFQNPGYFFSRPSAAGNGYDSLASGGSNLSPASKQFVKKIQERFQALKAINARRIPIDILTSSGSGLDPHISPQAAYWQAPKIALHRDVALKRVMAIIDDQIEHAQLYILGEIRVNVLKLNLTLDQFFGPPGEAK